MLGESFLQGVYALRNMSKFRGEPTWELVSPYSLTFGMKLSVALWIEFFIVAHMKSVPWLSIHRE